MKIQMIAAAALSILASGLAPASPVPDFPFILAEGSAEREVPPTDAEVTFKMLAFAKTSEESTSTVQAALAKVIAGLKEQGVGEDLITANELEKSAARGRNEESHRAAEIVGYEVSREVQLRLPDLKNYPAIVRVLMAADHISRVKSTFDTAQREEVESELVGEACAKARKKADLMAKGAGVTIKSVHAVSSDGFENMRLSGHSSLGLPDLSYGAADDSADIPLFVPTAIGLSSSVSILYRLAP
jgi:uncharacterized protein